MKHPVTDSRHIRPGDIFVAIPCDNVQQHIQQAIQQGAESIILSEEDKRDWQERFPSVEIITCQNPRLALSDLAKNLYPDQPNHTVAVTGTNGKSSTVHFVRQLWLACGYSSASLGSLGLIIKNEEDHDLNLPLLNTLDPLSAHKVLDYLKQKEIDYLAFEASSHGLNQYRSHNITLKAAAFTNFSQDHLDYHLTMEKYFKAKTQLFSEVLPIKGTAVLNNDSFYFEKLQKICLERSQKILSYSLTKPADLRAENIRQYNHFIEFDLSVLGQHFSNLKVNVVGRFQLENVLCAFGLALAVGSPLSFLIEALPSLTAVRGRMELVGLYKDASIYIDYSHKPEALQTALRNLRLHTTGKLWVVFGCGGNRDALKRPIMGKIANDYADCIIVTDDNPRHEDGSIIRQQILEQCPKAIEVGERRQAIRSAIAQLQEGDVLLIAGKGHETGQIVGNIIHPFDDKIEVRNFLREMTNG